MSDRPVEIIHRPNKLAKKVGRITLDPAKLAKAQKAVEALAADYPPQLLQEARRISELCKRGGFDEEALRHLHKLAHDVKGQATTFGYPLATAVGGALCRLFAPEVLEKPIARQVIDAHVAALVAIATERLAGDGGPVGAALLDGLLKTRRKVDLDD
jgi:hypothetical protein